MTAPETPRRKPKAGEHVFVYGDRLLIRRLTDRGRGPLAVLEDDAGWHIERRTDSMTWDPNADAWQTGLVVDAAGVPV